MLQLTFWEGFFYIYIFLRVCCLMQVWRLTFQAYHKRIRARAFVWACAGGLQYLQHLAESNIRSLLQTKEGEVSHRQSAKRLESAGSGRWFGLYGHGRRGGLLNPDWPRGGSFQTIRSAPDDRKVAVNEMLPVSWWSSATWGGLWADVASSDWPADLSWLLWSPPSPCWVAFITKTEEEGHRLARHHCVRPEGMVSEWGDCKYVKNDTNMTQDLVTECVF